MIVKDYIGDKNVKAKKNIYIYVWGHMLKRNRVGR